MAILSIQELVEKKRGKYIIDIETGHLELHLKNDSIDFDLDRNVSFFCFWLL